MNLQAEPAGGGAGPGRPSNERPVAITETEFLTDRLRVHYFCRRPWGVEDEQATVEVSYATIPTLPPVPRDFVHGEFRHAWVESVEVPACHATICFRFAQWQETDDCRMEGMVSGPFLLTDPHPASAANG